MMWNSALFAVFLAHCLSSAQFYTASIIDGYAFYPHFVADTADILNGLDPEISQFADMAEAFEARQYFDESAEFLDAGNDTIVYLSYFGFGGYGI